MVHVVTIDETESTLDPPDLLARLAARGVRILDGRRYLLLEVPAEVLAREDWTSLEAEARRSGAWLQNLGSLIAMTRSDTRPDELVDRILALDSGALPVLIATLGGLERIAGVARDIHVEAQLDLCYAAYLQALGHQVAQGLGEDDEPDDEPEDGPAGVPGGRSAPPPSASDFATAW